MVNKKTQGKKNREPVEEFVNMEEPEEPVSRMKVLEPGILTKKQQGKKNRQAGAKFELKVRKDLESKGWVVSKWMNNVKVSKEFCGIFAAKHRFRGPGIPMSIGTGFPDFIAFTYTNSNATWPIENPDKTFYLSGINAIMGVECKSNGFLTKEEKEKCRWLLENNKFSKILIASKGTKRGQIVYTEYN